MLDATLDRIIRAHLFPTCRIKPAFTQSGKTFRLVALTDHTVLQ